MKMVINVSIFRLTKNLVTSLGPSGIEGVFRKSCERVLGTMRNGSGVLLLLVQTFLHDPLVGV